MTPMLGQGYLHGDYDSGKKSSRRVVPHPQSTTRQHGRFHACYSVPDSGSMHWSGFPGRTVLSGQTKADGSNSY